MGSGAYSIFIDPPAGGGPQNRGRRVVPVPPPENSGGVKFTTVVLSLAYEDLQTGVHPTGMFRVLRGGHPRHHSPSTSRPGGHPSPSCTRTIRQCRWRPTPVNDKLAEVTALVEYTTP
jgi:hypothetical protein